MQLTDFDLVHWSIAPASDILKLTLASKGLRVRSIIGLNIIGLLLASAVVCAGNDDRVAIASKACRQAIEDHYGTDDIEQVLLQIDDEGDVKAVQTMMHERIIPELSKSTSATDRAAAVAFSFIPQVNETPQFPLPDEKVQQGLDALEQALQIDSQNLLALSLSFRFCYKDVIHPVCSMGVGETMVQADPENAASWLMLLSEHVRAGNQSGILDDLESIAVFPMNLHSQRSAWTVIKSALQHWPEVSWNQELILAGYAMQIDSFAGLGLLGFGYTELRSECLAETVLAKGKSRQQICRQLGSNLASTGTSGIDKSVGLGLEEVALLALGEADESKALKANRQAESDRWLSRPPALTDCFIAEGLLPDSGPHPWLRMLEERSRLGETESWRRYYQRQLDRWAPEPGGLSRADTP